MSDEEDIILSELSDEDLVLQMHDDLYDGLKEEVEEALKFSSIVAGPLSRFSEKHWSMV